MILPGDALTILKTLPDESVQCCVTSPPYWGLRDYGISGQLGLEKTPEEYVEKMVEVFREVKRVLKKDGTLWLNLGDSYATTGGKHYGAGNNGVCGSTKAGVCLRNHALPNGIKQKDLVGIPWLVAFALRADGWYLRSDIIWSKCNPMPESVTDRPTKSHEYIFLFSKQKTYYYDQEAVREPNLPASLKRWEPGSPKIESIGSKNAEFSKTKWGATRVSEKSGDLLNPNGRNLRSVWTIATQPYSEAHFATFPFELAERCVRAGSKEGDTVLDPFCGAATVGLVCKKLQREFIGIELNPEYVRMGELRIERECGGLL